MKRWVKIILFISVFISIICGVLLSISFNYIPSIKLKGDSVINIKINQVYKDDGASATIFDHDVSKDIKVIDSVDYDHIGEYKITYKISNKYLKKSNQVERTIIIVDEDAPSIKLKGKSTVTLYVGQKYEDEGVEVIDNYDVLKDEDIVIDSNVDTKKAGEYLITYTIKDSSGNESTISRKVIVKVKTTTTTTTKVTTTLLPGETTTAAASLPSNVGTGRGISILMYHYFYDAEAGEDGKDSNYIEKNSFDAQMKYLNENGYYFPTWQEVADFVDGKITLPSKSVVITADDGHESFFRIALPILEKYQVKATAFIITDRRSNVYQNYSSSYVSYQSHTHSMHQGGCSGGSNGRFRCISLEDGVADLNKSFSLIGGNNEAIAYPFGDVNQNALDIVKQTPIKVGVTTKYGRAKKGMDRLRLPRMRMYKGMSLSAFINSL